MLATRPSSEQAAAAASPQEEKNIPGVSTNALKEERTPLLDLDDVDQFESELAACFDAPPPPPLNIRREEPVATVSSWTPAAEPRYVETIVAPPTPSVVAAAAARGELPQREEQEEQQHRQQQATRVSDFSSLYSATPHRAESVGQLYPALVPSAPSSEAMRIPNPHSAAAPAAPVAHGGQAASSATVPVSVVAAGVDAVRAARERGAEVGSSGQVVDELLSENERLRLIIQEMSEELERVSVQGGSSATAAAGGRARQAQSQSQRPAPAAAASATPAQRLLGRYPGAQAEAARRQREHQQQQSRQGQQQQQDQTQAQTQAQTFENLRPGMFVHFKCDNCPQWLKVPGHAQLVYCPLCGHTSQMTAGSTIHFPPNNETPSNGGSASGARGAASGQEEVGWIGYFKSIIAS